MNEAVQVLLLLFVFPLTSIESKFDWSEVRSPGDGRSGRSSSHQGPGLFTGVDLAEMSVLLWRRKVFNRVEVELGFKII